MRYIGVWGGLFGTAINMVMMVIHFNWINFTVFWFCAIMAYLSLRIARSY